MEHTSTWNSSLVFLSISGTFILDLVLRVGSISKLLSEHIKNLKGSLLLTEQLALWWNWDSFSQMEAGGAPQVMCFTWSWFWGTVLMNATSHSSINVTSSNLHAFNVLDLSHSHLQPSAHHFSSLNLVLCTSFECTACIKYILNRCFFRGT